MRKIASQINIFQTQKCNFHFLGCWMISFSYVLYSLTVVLSKTCHFYRCVPHILFSGDQGFGSTAQTTNTASPVIGILH